MLSDHEERTAQQFLDRLDTELTNAGEPGTHQWRAARDAQLSWLHEHHGWEPDVLARHYGISHDTVRVALNRHRAREAAAQALPAFDDDTTTTAARSRAAGRWNVRIPDYSIDLTVDHDTASKLHDLATDHHIDVHVTRISESRSPTTALRTPQTR
ncbi:hypothetical protein [Gordonia aichiensis]|uniref:Uncharacterized protein n=1 Tax=Gordonia aichiensis NBRC 108223 TaxID=1220583 RepID=L7KF48_9ACTN|nr:hypothetical protein [Gordonia aichiensis]GAC47480.1 hypothetical protein GOACH_03_05020 [Gordonia aichiensis NBRC 108223]